MAEANRAAAEYQVLSGKSAAIRRIVPWEALLPVLKSRQGTRQKSRQSREVPR